MRNDLIAYRSPRGRVAVFDGQGEQVFSGDGDAAWGQALLLRPQRVYLDAAALWLDRPKKLKFEGERGELQLQLGFP